MGWSFIKEIFQQFRHFFFLLLGFEHILKNIYINNNKINITVNFLIIYKFIDDFEITDKHKTNKKN
jgi:hypothetical protein